MRKTPTWGDPSCFRIVADDDVNQLCFQEGTKKTKLTALDLAEHLLAEKMLKLNLDAD
jgi:hypothetical protein